MDFLPKVISGDEHHDSRGTIHFVNDFDMSEVKRFYCIHQPDITVIRGWRGHQIEQRWFNIVQGAFLIRLVKIDDWSKPNPGLPQASFVLSVKDNVVLHVPTGFATAVQALEKDSKMLVFADYGIENAENDNHLFPSNYFDNRKK